MTQDRHRLSRRLHDIEQLAGSKRDYAAQFEQWQLQFNASKTLVSRRQEAVPNSIEFPNLPVSEKRDEIAGLIAAHQVVVLAGETGSGKTTQIPKICLTLGRGVRGMIGHTQPRRIAAHTVASRIAEELHTNLGDKVGYQV